MRKGDAVVFVRVCLSIVFFSAILFACGKGLNNPNLTRNVLEAASYLGFRDFAPSGLFRSPGKPQLTIAEEHALGALPSSLLERKAQAYREIPVFELDDESLWSSATALGLHDGPPCGTAQVSIEERAAHCATEWDGEEHTRGPAAKWRLITRTASRNEVWQDMRTGLLWSDYAVAEAVNWCAASGNDEDLRGYMDGVNCSEEHPNVCREASSIDARGGINGSGVQWYLPSIYDWLQAELDGIRFVLRNISTTYWSSSSRLVSGSIEVRVFLGVAGGASTSPPFSTWGVRCVARSGTP